MSLFRCAAASCLFLLIACGTPLQAAPGDEPANNVPAKPVASKEDPAEHNREFDAELLKIAASYKTYGRVDDEMRWAPWLCRMPMPAMARFSKSEEVETHGQKMYYLFAKDRGDYVKLKGKGKPKTGQVVVKESWHSKETSPKSPTRIWKDTVRDPIVKSNPTTKANDPKSQPAIKAFDTGGGYYPYAKKDGKTYHADVLAGLYIMFKTDAKTPNTDNGWVYGTVTADGKTVTAAGRVTSCMNCHKEAPHGRLFGLQLRAP